MWYIKTECVFQFLFEMQWKDFHCQKLKNVPRKLIFNFQWWPDIEEELFNLQKSHCFCLEKYIGSLVEWGNTSCNRKCWRFFLTPLLSHLLSIWSGNKKQGVVRITCALVYHLIDLEEITNKFANTHKRYKITQKNRKLYLYISCEKYNIKIARGKKKHN